MDYHPIQGGGGGRNTPSLLLCCGNWGKVRWAGLNTDFPYRVTLGVTKRFSHAYVHVCVR